jgi:hypothetical protein
VSAPRVFILSPARLDGERAKRLLRPDRDGLATPTGRGPAASVIGCALRLRTREGVPIGQVFELLSSLYFRGKLGYATRFARPPEVAWIGGGALVITANRGLIPAETRVCLEHLEAFAQTEIHHDERAFRGPLERDAEQLAADLGAAGEVVLLGSVASKKYVEPLLAVLGERLLFPADFVGRGDMSRGGLLLRAVEAGQELRYIPVAGAILRGKRPPKLTPRDSG